MTTTEFRAKLEQRKGQKQQVEKSILSTQNKIEDLEAEVIDIQEAQLILQTVAVATQRELEFHISDLVSMALDSVFPDPYRLALDFVLKRGKSEADISFVRGDEEEKIHPLSAAGGGAVDVAAFALRVSLWSLANPRTRNVLILDEPFKNINDSTRTMHTKAAEMIKMISDKLNLQIIIITLLPEILDTADKVFEIKNVKGVSKVI